MLGEEIACTMSKERERQRLATWATSYPRHFWALGQLPKDDQLRSSFARQIRRGETLSKKQLDLLWRKADELEWRASSGETAPKKGVSIQTKIQITAFDPNVETRWGEVSRVSFLAFPQGWRGRIDLKAEDTQVVEGMASRTSDFAYIKGDVVWQKGVFVIVEATQIILE